MAMAVAAATVSADSTSSSFCSGAWSECGRGLLIRSRVEQLTAPVICSRTWSVTGAAAVGCGRETRTIPAINSSFSCASTRRDWRRQAVAEQLQAEETQETAEEGFPYDTLSVFFEAEGSLSEALVPKLTATLEEVEGVSNVDVSASSDGTATVKLTKQMNVQATGVASSLVDILLKGGFKLQALNLGFDEEDGDDDEFYDYDIATSTEEAEAAE